MCSPCGRSRDGLDEYCLPLHRETLLRRDTHVLAIKALGGQTGCVARKTQAEHELEQHIAQELISSGRVTSWAELGRAFNITPQAANARFGKQYNLQIPRPPRQFRRMVSVSLDGEMDAMLEDLRASGASRAQIVRDILARELPKLHEQRMAS